MEQFKATHKLKISDKGKRRTRYWKVKVVNRIVTSSGFAYYNVITSPHNRSGIHWISNVPESNLKEL
jgi:hypothetical protein